MFPVLPTSAPRITAHADQILSKTKFMELPYFKALRNGEMTLEQFRQTQEQFYFVVTYVPRPMAALMSKLPDPYARQGILENLLDEHGHFQSEHFHAATMKRFVENIGGNTSFNRLQTWPAANTFNNLLLGTCTLDEVEVGASCLGIIEYAFVEISAAIAQQSIKNGWISPEKLVHYSLHHEVDPKHAEDFFVLVEAQWDNPLRRPLIEKGLELGAYAFKCLYQGLYEMAVNPSLAPQKTLALSAVN